MSAVKDNKGWKAELMLRFALSSNKQTAGKTLLISKKQYGPLTVQRPFYPESDLCHLYLLHPPGGVVGGDSLLIKASVESGAALLTTPGASKFYRSNGAEASQIQRFYVKPDSSLEWLPQENIFFPGAHCHTKTEIQLHKNSSFIGWEIHCLGRPANNEQFFAGQVRQELAIFRDTKPLLLETLLISGEQHGKNITGMQGYPVSAILIATDLCNTTLRLIQQQFADANNASLGYTLLDDLLVCRYLGHSTEQVQKIFIAIWEIIRPRILQRKACPPRIWST